MSFAAVAEVDDYTSLFIAFFSQPGVLSDASLCLDLRALHHFGDKITLCSPIRILFLGTLSTSRYNSQLLSNCSFCRRACPSIQSHAQRCCIAFPFLHVLSSSAKSPTISLRTKRHNSAPIVLFFRRPVASASMTFSPPTKKTISTTDAPSTSAQRTPSATSTALAHFHQFFPSSPDLPYLLHVVHHFLCISFTASTLGEGEADELVSLFIRPAFSKFSFQNAILFTKKYLDFNNSLFNQQICFVGFFSFLLTGSQNQLVSTFCLKYPADAFKQQLTLAYLDSIFFHLNFPKNP